MEKVGVSQIMIEEWSNPTRIGYRIVESIRRDGEASLVCIGPHGMARATLAIISANSVIRRFSPDVEVVMSGVSMKEGCFMIRCSTIPSAIVNGGDQGSSDVSSSLSLPEEMLLADKIIPEKIIWRKNPGEDAGVDSDNEVTIEDLIATFEWSDEDD